MYAEILLPQICDIYKTVYYRPQRSWANVIFSQACVCPQGGRGVCLSACWDTPPGSRHLPPEQTPPGSRHPPRTRHKPPRELTPRDQTPPLEQTPPDQAHPLEQTPLPDQAHPPPPREADCSIRLTSSRYASYWNAFLCSFIKFDPS